MDIKTLFAYLLIPVNKDVFKKKSDLEKIFKISENLNEKNIVFSCGSGVTCVLALLFSNK